MTNEQYALLRVMHAGILELRQLGWRTDGGAMTVKNAKLVADIADAIHNIPDALDEDDITDLEFHTTIMLGGFEERHPTYTRFKPLDLYKRNLELLTRSESEE